MICEDIFFGDEASTASSRARLEHDVKSYTDIHADIPDVDAIENLCRNYGKAIAVVIHAGTAVARLGGAGAAYRFHSQCKRHAQSSRMHAPRARRALHLHEH